uniref:Pep_M12B_propep domain-containing protein n=1 Tax=Anopheles atroparvus TaxID=41427 RepID=A0A182J9G3_ANOAO
MRIITNPQDIAADGTLKAEDAIAFATWASSFAADHLAESRSPITASRNRPARSNRIYLKAVDVSDGQRGSQIHRTGAFRSRSSKIWDPHPQYELSAFGNNLHLKLWHDDKFISKDMKVTHFWPNETLRRAEDHIESNLLQGCFYKGVVLGDDSSSVRVSLCEGMHGHIVTSNGSFLIEPVQNALSGEPSVLHRIQRLTVEKSGTDGRIPIDGLGTPVEDCADFLASCQGASALIAAAPREANGLATSQDETMASMIDNTRKALGMKKITRIGRGNVAPTGHYHKLEPVGTGPKGE